MFAICMFHKYNLKTLNVFLSDNTPYWEDEEFRPWCIDRSTLFYLLNLLEQIHITNEVKELF